MAWGAAAGLLLIAAVGASVFDLPRRVDHWLHGAALPAQKQLAVLPFTNVGGDPANSAFCEGLAELLTTGLTQLEQFQHSLRVVPATEVRREQVGSAREARRIFGATLVITGSVQRTRDRVRLTMNLVDARALQQLRAREINMSTAEASVLQDEVVAEAARMLELAIEPQARAILTAGGTQAPGANDFYVQGRGYLQRFEKLENVDQAIALFDRSLSEDPNYALAHAALGEAYWRKYDLTKEARWIDPAREHCTRALRLDRRLAQVHVTLGLIDRGTGQYEAAVADLRQALRLDPVSGDAYRELARVYEDLGQTASAEETFQKAIAVRPGDWSAYNAFGGFYARHGQYANAEAQFRRVIDLTPDNARGYTNLGNVYLLSRRYDDAAAALERSAAIKPDGPAYSGLGTIYFSRRRYADAARMFERAVQFRPGDYRLWRNLGAARYWAPDQRPAALAAFERAAALGEDERTINPRRADLLANLADCYSLIGQPARARQLAQQAVDLAPDDASVLLRAGTAHEQIGDRSRAIDLLGRAIHAGLSTKDLEEDPALTALRQDPRFGRLVAQ